MGSIAVSQSTYGFKKATAICGNCVHECRKRDEKKDQTERTCSKHGWFILMSSTCNDHQYRSRGTKHVVT